MMAAMELKLGYKASAEQFGPRELLDLGVAAARPRWREVAHAP